MSRGGGHSQRGGVLEAVLAIVALLVAAVALVVALTRDSGSSGASQAPTTTTLSAQQICDAQRARYNAQMRFLVVQQKKLADMERTLNQQLTDQLMTHSPNAGATDASHQAVLRQQMDVQERILGLQGDPSRVCP